MTTPKTTSSKQSISLKSRAWAVSSAFPTELCLSTAFLWVLEFKSAVKENTTIMDAYKQLTVRYRRDIPELLKYNTFVVISDGANNKYGSLFSPYDYFYAWRKVESEDKELDGINSLVTMMKGLFRKDRLLAVIKILSISPTARIKS